MSFSVKNCCICEYLFNSTKYPCCSKCYYLIKYKSDMDCCSIRIISFSY